MESLYNIANHPLMPELFSWFDTDHDGTVWYDDFVKGLDIVERGDFE
jgi:Ca2+-binding EF-hand superfamily protein